MPTTIDRPIPTTTIVSRRNSISRSPTDAHLHHYYEKKVARIGVARLRRGRYPAGRYSTVRGFHADIMQRSVHVTDTYAYRYALKCGGSKRNMAEQGIGHNVVPCCDPWEVWRAVPRANQARRFADVAVVAVSSTSAPNIRINAVRAHVRIHQAGRYIAGRRNKVPWWRGVKRVGRVWRGAHVTNRR